jgi:signal transduction histidine kinase
LDEADSQLRSLGEITSRSLAFVRPDTEAKEIDLVDLASSALRLHHEQISKKRINLQMRSSESALARLKKGEIFQVVTNLLLNSIEALPHSGNLHVRVAIRRSNAIITIADNGAGIPVSMRGTLFDAFKSNKSEGNGLARQFPLPPDTAGRAGAFFCEPVAPAISHTVGHPDRTNDEKKKPLVLPKGCH